MTKIIAMWSGPRNLSTAMMRSFSSRADCAVMDEPFYAAYLAASGANHPMGETIVNACETDPQKIIATCVNDNRAPISYQKHMIHHMLDEFPLDWINTIENVLLIRHPARVLASYAAKRDHPSASDVGVQAQKALYDRLRDQGRAPVIVDAGDIRAKPAAMLKALCDALEIAYDPAMLSWASGPHTDDGIWGDHWYDAIRLSTGFAPPDNKPLPQLTGYLRTICEEVIPDYNSLYERRLCDH